MFAAREPSNLRLKLQSLSADDDAGRREILEALNALGEPLSADEQEFLKMPSALVSAGDTSSAKADILKVAGQDLKKA